MTNEQMNCTCKNVGNGMMKQNKNCPEHGMLAQYFERERQDYLHQIKTAQHRIQRTAFSAFCGGVIFGMFVMFILNALL